VCSFRFQRNRNYLASLFENAISKQIHPDTGSSAVKPGGLQTPGATVASDLRCCAGAEGRRFSGGHPAWPFLANTELFMLSSLALWRPFWPQRVEQRIRHLWKPVSQKNMLANSFPLGWKANCLKSGWLVPSKYLSSEPWSPQTEDLLLAPLPSLTLRWQSLKD